MSIYVISELTYMCKAFVVGFIVILGYNLLIAFRQMVKHNKVIVVIEDLLYWIMAAIYVFVCIYYINEGAIRNSFIFGATLGMLFCQNIAIKYLKKWGRAIKMRITRLIKKCKEAKDRHGEKFGKAKKKV